jgi:tRNA (cmo5U34)-methyltransferase
MATPINQFNKVAVVYDWLASIFIGRSIRDAQRFFLNEVADAKQILILGGGTGWILRDIRAINKTSSVFYVEASSEMIKRATRCDKGSQTVFLHGTESDVDVTFKFDIVITNFYFDLFSPESLSEKVNLIKSFIADEAKWIATDFAQSKKSSHLRMLWLMYRFFSWTTNIESSSLPPWEKVLEAAQLEIIRSETFKDGFIRSVVARQCSVI